MGSIVLYPTAEHYTDFWQISVKAHPRCHVRHPSPKRLIHHICACPHPTWVLGLTLEDVTDTAYDALRSFIESSSEVPEPLAAARRDAEEFGLTVPDEMTGQLLATLAATSRHEKSTGAVAVTPAAAVAGWYLLRGLGDHGTLTCIDSEAEHQANARTTFREAGYAPSRVRFLPSRPLDVMGRLANESYQLVYAEVSPADLPAILATAWPLLTPGGTLVLADSLLDGTIADASRKDRATAAAREADDSARNLEGALVTRLPLGAGLTLVTRL